MQSSSENIFELKVKSSTQYLGEIREFIQAAALENNIPEKIIADVILSVDEACTNIIKHAYHSNPQNDFIIKLFFSKNEIKIVLVDYGDSFNLNAIESPNMEIYFKQKKVGGLGLYLIRSLMDEVKYKSIKGEYNELILAKKLN